MRNPIYSMTISVPDLQPITIYFATKKAAEGTYSVLQELFTEEARRIIKFECEEHELYNEEMAVEDFMKAFDITSNA